MLVYYFVPFIVSNLYFLFWVSNGHNSVTVQNRTHVYMNFFSQRPRKSPPAVMSWSRETPCIIYTYGRRRQVWYPWFNVLDKGGGGNAWIKTPNTRTDDLISVRNELTIYPISYQTFSMVRTASRKQARGLEAGPMLKKWRSTRHAKIINLQVLTNEISAD